MENLEDLEKSGFSSFATAATYTYFLFSFRCSDFEDFPKFKYLGHSASPVLGRRFVLFICTRHSFRLFLHKV